MLGYVFRNSTDHKKQNLKSTVLTQAESKGRMWNTLASFGLRLRQQSRVLALAPFFSKIFLGY